MALVTGHEDPDKDETAIDWTALAAFPGTLVFYMGVRRLPHIAASLIAAGTAPTEPAAVVERGTLPDQRTVIGTLATIAEVARAEEVRAPSITVVGAVAELAEQVALALSAPAERVHGRGHAGAGADQRTRPAAARAGGRRGAGARHPHPAASMGRPWTPRPTT